MLRILRTLHIWWSTAVLNFYFLSSFVICIRPAGHSYVLNSFRVRNKVSLCLCCVFSVTTVRLQNNRQMNPDPKLENCHDEVSRLLSGRHEWSQHTFVGLKEIYLYSHSVLLKYFQTYFYLNSMFWTLKLFSRFKPAVHTEKKWFWMCRQRLSRWTWSEVALSRNMGSEVIDLTIKNNS